MDKNTSGPIDDLDDVDVPTYHGVDNPTARAYQRAGRVAPEVIKPADKAFPIDENPTTQIARVNTDKTSAPAPKEPVEAEKTQQIPVVSEEFNFSNEFKDFDFTKPTTGVPPIQEISSVLPTSTPQYSEGVQPQQAEDARRGTMDFGLFILRACVGLLFIAQSVAVFFQLGGSTGLSGLQEQFQGYAMPELLSIMLPSLELVAGTFLLLGLATPAAAAVAVVAATTRLLHTYIYDGTYSEQLLLYGIILVLALAIQFTGPGRGSFDYARSWARRPLLSSWIFFFLGIIGAAALWIFTAGVNPFA